MTDSPREQRSVVVTEGDKAVAQGCLSSYPGGFMLRDELHGAPSCDKSGACFRPSAPSSTPSSVEWWLSTRPRRGR